MTMTPIVEAPTLGAKLLRLCCGIATFVVVFIFYGPKICDLNIYYTSKVMLVSTARWLNGRASDVESGAPGSILTNVIFVLKKILIFLTLFLGRHSAMPPS